MSLGQSVAPHLPYLRRYGRSISGSQPSGDALVARLLETLVANPGAVDVGADLRIQLYRMVHDNFGLMTEQAAGGEAPSSDIAIADARLRRIPSLARQALLLTAVEGFSVEDTGRIIGRDAEAVRGLIADATDEIDRQTRARILIIEDEPIIAMDIEMIVRELGHDVVGVATTHREAVDEAQKHQPGLVLADIQLADNSSGIEAVQEILTDLKVPVIFITAFPERLLTGDRPEPAFLLTKPYQPATLRAAISQVLFFDESTIPA
ncbi:Response regulator receiver domain-containing protein [Sphingopyxis sp. YR583]|jgi:CheY-like chemotaxis protein/DNA-directed RNA polymerase specialized sigma24 family protein|uniref:response regulator n=1 Tax=Sphingopyxis sp. YR583 TaxID=1881047 RepID=UPI0008A749B9|nr:response regulator [Sphingopyxis sp. YR583]SEH13541.1 Response regulator receiver domain-containing protein [Sphingopyxis sp. YR583]